MDQLTFFMQQVVGGVATGVIYGSVALALVVIFQATHKINFAQGEMATFCTFVAWALIQAGVPYWCTFAATVVFAFALGVVVERLVIRPLAGAPMLSVVIVFIGLLLIFNSLSGALFGQTLRQFPSPSRDIPGWAAVCSGHTKLAPSWSA